MSETAISVEKIWKEYRLGTLSHRRMVTDLQSWWARLRGREDPNAIINPLSPALNQRGQEGEGRFWALKDVSFEVKRGEVLGIIGRNGAGKSTLLKILSRVTAPTRGEATYQGRIASLLEVGTGFHPELTGRENVFLNGAILGMSKGEILRKFDEIVAFAEIETFIDTPVKRYSSGMYVRLAFGVAAHLEPEILIIDEVLAVGDAAFQKKCLGKMKAVGHEGRTVLFVSHNLAAITALCSRALLLNEGQVVCDLQAEDTVQRYLARDGLKAVAKVDLRTLTNVPERRKCAQLHSLALYDQHGRPGLYIRMGEGLKIELAVEFLASIRQPEVGVVISKVTGERIVRFVSTWEGLTDTTDVGMYEYAISLQELMLVPGNYTLTPWVKRRGEEVDDIVEGALVFEVGASDLTGNLPYFERYCRPGEFYARSQWKVRALPDSL